MKIEGLEFTVSGPMIGPHWTDPKDGNRYHFWLRAEANPNASDEDRQRNDTSRPVSPYMVREDRGRVILYRNPPLNVGRYDDGYFKTRYLDASAKANREVVSEVLRRCKDEGLFEKALQANAEKAANERRATFLKFVDDIREAITEAMPNLGAEAMALAGTIREASDDALFAVGKAIVRGGR